MFFKDGIISTLSFGRLPIVAAWVPIRNLSEFWLWKEEIPELFEEMERTMDFVRVPFGQVAEIDESCKTLEDARDLPRQGFYCNSKDFDRYQNEDIGYSPKNIILKAFGSTEY